MERLLELKSSCGFSAISLFSLIRFYTIIAISTCTYDWLPFSPLFHEDLIDIVHNVIIGLKPIRECWRSLGFKTVHPTYNWFFLIITCGRLSLGPASTFVWRLRIRHVYGLVVLCLTVPLPLLDCLESALWLQGALEPPIAVSDQFMFLPVGPAAPHPHFYLVLPFRLPQPLDYTSIWSIKEFYNLKCNVGDGFVKYFHWPNKLAKNCVMVWSVRYASYLFHPLAITSSYIVFIQP
jgi:hypothetical protein